MTKTSTLFSPAKSHIMHIIAIIIAVLMALTPAVLGVQATETTDTSPTIYSVDFENYTNGDYTPITTEVSRNGDKAAVLSPISGMASPYNGNMIRFDNDNEGNTVEKNDTDDFFIAFYAKASSDFETSNMLRIDAGRQKNPTYADVAYGKWWYFGANSQWTTGTKLEAVKNDWQLGYLSAAKIEDGYKYMSLYYNDAGSGYSAGKVYIDDVMIAKYNSSVETVIILDGNYSGAEYDLLIVEKGAEAVTLPTLTRNGCTFAGWYTDAACTTAYTSEINPTEITRLYAKWEKTKYSIDFENYADSDYTQITTEVSRNGDKAAVLSPISGMSSPYSGNMIRFDSDNEGDPVQKTDTDDFFIAFYAKASSDFETSNMLRIDAGRQKAATYADVAWGKWWYFGANSQWATGTKLDAVKNNWQLGYLSAAKVADTYKYMSLYYNDSGSGYSAGEVYIDDVMIAKYDSSTETVIILDGNYSGAEYDLLVVEMGAAATELSTPTREGYVFGGWYTDAACTTAYTSETNPTAITRLYAKWDKLKYSIGFENYTDSDYTQITTEVSRNGNAAAVLEPISGYTSPYSGNMIRFDSDNDGDTVEKNDTNDFFIAFYAKASSDFETSNMLRIDAGRQKTATYTDTAYGKWWYFGANAQWATGTKLDAVKNDWQLGYLSAAKVEDTYKYMSLYYNDAGSGYSAGKVYIDDVMIAKYNSSTEAVIILDGNYSGAEYDLLVVEMGAAATELPILTREGYVFGGWYTDAACTTPYTSATNPTANTRLYARWEEKVLYEAGFEDGVLNADDTFSINFDTAYVKSGNSSLKFANSAGGTASYALLTENGENIVLEDGVKYVVNYSYMIVDPDATLKYLRTAVYRANGENGIHKALVSENLQLASAATSNNKWLDYSYTFVADLEDTSSADIISLYTYVGTDSEGNTAQIYFDDITVRKVRDTEGTVNFIYNDMDSSQKTVVGTLDTNAEIPELTKEYYSLGGWCTDAELTSVATDIKYTSDGATYYADWHLRYYKQDFENYSVSTITSDTDTEIYNRVYLDDPFILAGNKSLHRIGDEAYNKQFSVMCDERLYLKPGRTYTVSMYVKVLNVGADSGEISLVNTKSPFNPWSYDETNVLQVASLSELENGVWNKISVELTAVDLYLAVRTPAECELYIDDVIVYDTSVTPEEEIYPEAPYAAGDVDHDGSLHANDLAELRSIMLNDETIEYFVPVDVNRDYQIDARDVVRLKKWLTE